MEIVEVRIPPKFKPSHLKLYRERSNPSDLVAYFKLKTLQMDLDDTPMISYFLHYFQKVCFKVVLTPPYRCYNFIFQVQVNVRYIMHRRMAITQELTNVI